MDNTDANSANDAIDATGQHVRIIKIYPLDGKPVAESQLWVAVTQIQNEISKRLFLRDGHQHRLISVQTALSLLPRDDQKDLSAILKLVSNKGGSSPAITNNAIKHIHHYTGPTNENQTFRQN